MWCCEMNPVRELNIHSLWPLMVSFVQQPTYFLEWVNPFTHADTLKPLKTILKVTFFTFFSFLERVVFDSNWWVKLLLKHTHIRVSKHQSCFCEPVCHAPINKIEHHNHWGETGSPLTSITLFACHVMSVYPPSLLFLPTLSLFTQAQLQFDVAALRTGSWWVWFKDLWSALSTQRWWTLV